MSEYLKYLVEDPFNIVDVKISLTFKYPFNLKRIYFWMLLLEDKLNYPFC